MSLPTWTPAALSSSARPYSGTAWRLVEAQHRVSTLRLVETLAEQQLLEEILDESKPVVPAECQGLDYLLSTPFRYGAAYPHGSRFRRAGRTLGVFYAAETVETAIAELAFYRVLFFAESPGTELPEGASDYTAFSVALDVGSMLDLTAEPLSADAALWSDLVDYTACQALADAARGVEVALLRYRSVRDPAHGANLAVLSCRAFSQPAPLSRQTWKIRLGPGRVQALCEFPVVSLEFAVGDFAVDPRLAGLRK
ncbi:MAG: RES family NAD+ phosphorylase [Alphaproteobacteria bacterium]|nr:RES family NAD+ phosphorylase [Alphaproteobacteria bacterium]MBU1561709.1 RES family NAD+ phosphorylase [Alphaproteobacteria bacterium]MBU2303017.1 RES family NAD+ phosphorylase [Alphaproteobacteria bacterium]MBU2368803.1 RES family NAD+ phosphorylase [Alphaproteobacteria bacterium]